MTRKQQYSQYLSSPQWKKLRKEARERAGGKCELCGGRPDNVHHVKYPKRFKDDHIDNLLVVCSSCHQKVHGIREQSMYMDMLVSPLEVWVYAEDYSVWVLSECNPQTGDTPRPFVNLRHAEQKNIRLVSSELEGQGTPSTEASSQRMFKANGAIYDIDERLLDRVRHDSEDYFESSPVKWGVGEPGTLLYALLDPGPMFLPCQSVQEGS